MGLKWINGYFHIFSICMCEHFIFCNRFSKWKLRYGIYIKFQIFFIIKFSSEDLSLFTFLKYFSWHFADLQGAPLTCRLWKCSAMLELFCRNEWYKLNCSQKGLSFSFVYGFISMVSLNLVSSISNPR